VVLGPNGSYLTGWCRLREDDRVFRMDRIRSAQPMPGTAGLARPAREPDVPDLVTRVPVWDFETGRSAPHSVRT
jgi:predicted DNA-binding transcriptional regulator YafY